MSSEISVVAMGASAGGVEAVGRVLERLPKDLGAAVLVVIHTSARAESHLPEIFSRRGSMPARNARDGEPLRAGRVYIAPPDFHLVTGDGAVRLDGGPRVNGHRPAIDVLLKSVAASHASRAIGVILSGNLDDGGLGLLAIRQAGGVGLVQDPEEAAYPSMPRAAIRIADPDYVARLPRIALLIRRLVEGRAEGRRPEPADWIPGGRQPHAIRPGVEDTPGEVTGITCPECHGVIWLDESQGQAFFRCRIGHQFSLETLFDEQSRFLEQALWAAVRSLRERRSTAEALAKSAERAGLKASAKAHRERADASARYADEIESRLIRHTW